MEEIKNIISPAIIISAVLAVVAFLIAYGIGKIANRLKHTEYAENSIRIQRTIVNTGRVIRGLIILFFILLIFEVNGIKVTSFMASLGIAGALIALASQDLMKDLISGIYITTEKMFSIKDIINYNGEDGEVIDFNLRSTKVRIIKNDNIMYISNRNISDVKIISSLNYIDIPLPYEMSQSRVDSLMERVVYEINGRDDVKEAFYLGPQEFQSSAIAHRMIYKCNPINRGDIARTIRRIILRELEAENVSIPYEKIEVISSKDERN